ncbi:MAG: thioredoxin domain-containing protein [bacterium]|jgi:protein-disulfide isomerase|nr:hypothetical protein [Deltaproteobacteria bacterium]MCP4239656.1 thioredoxin domain-containing protein [bacterium]
MAAGRTDPVVNALLEGENPLQRASKYQKEFNTLSDRASGTSLIVAAVIIGAAIVASSWMLKASIDAGSAQITAAAGQMEELTAKLNAPPPKPQAAARPSRPNPNKKYTVDIGGSPTRGPDSAPVKIVEWSDFQCPFCSRVGPTLDQIEETYGDQVQLVFKHMPLAFHKQALPAHAAAEAAGMQGKFWEMHDMIFANQRELTEANYLAYATELGLDTEKFKEDLGSDTVGKRIAADKAQAGKLGVTGTPAFYVNGRFLSGAQPFASFKAMIDKELAN